MYGPFKFEQKVIITEGFFAGRPGYIVDCQRTGEILQNEDRHAFKYLVKITDTVERWVNEEWLKSHD